MTVSIAASERALLDPAPLDVSDPSFFPDTELKAPIGVNLTLLGAALMNVPGEGASAPFLKRVNVPLLASSVHACHEGNIDSIVLDRDFHVRPTAPPQSAALDGVTIAGKISAGKTPKMCVQVPSDPSYMYEAIALLTSARVKDVAIMVTLQELDDYRGFKRAADDARAAGLQVWLLANSPDYTADHADIALTMFDAVRVRSADMNKVRRMRFALRDAARKANKQFTTYVDMGIVISGTFEAAEERALLISQMNGSELFEDMLSVTGTVYDVADAIESWVGLGAVDGVILTPASLPSDLVSVLKGVLPLLEARAKMA